MPRAVHKNGLGKGLADLFAEDRLSQGDENTGVMRLSMTLIEPNKGQPRKEFDAQALAELAKSISMHGVITPITVRRQESGYFQIIAGERRWRAARDAGLTEIPAMIMDVTDSEVMQLALIENLQRQDLNPIEEAEGYEVLMREYGLTQDKVSERVGKSRSAVANALRLLALEDEIRKMLTDGRLSSGHARAVLSIREEDMRLEAAKAMENLSVRQAESLAKRINKTEKPAVNVDETVVDYVEQLEKKLEGQLGRRVRIESGKTHGTLSLEYYGDEDLERLSEALSTVAEM